MRDTFWIDGVSCRELGIQLQGTVTFSAAAPQMTSYTVPGRNGELHLYDGSFSNVTGTAACFLLDPGRVQYALAAVADWTLADPGYHRLEVSDEPEVYRLAAVHTGPETEIRMRTLAPFELQFNCKPQRFLKRGERAIPLGSGGAVLRNPGMPALPLITVYGAGAGTLSVSGITVSMLDTFVGPLVLDCDTQNAYFGPENKNSEISAPSFPVLPAGECKINWTGGIERVEITPRWWTL